MNTRPTPEKTTPGLSLCMIVRDCETELACSLDSIRDFVDEMIVVDTGSRDATREVARSRGARVFDFTWCDSFSAARNHSLEMAEGEWIFWMDADDVLCDGGGRLLRQAIASRPLRDAAFWVDVEQPTAGDIDQREFITHAHIKLFPSHPSIRFHGRVHEHVMEDIRKLGLAIETSKITVHHQRDSRDIDKHQNRLLRNLRLLALELDDRPEDPLVLMNLAMTQLGLPDGSQQAVAYARRALDRLTPTSTAAINTTLVLMSAHHDLGDVASELRAGCDALRHAPNDSMLLWHVGHIHRRRNNLSAAIDCFQRILNHGKLRIALNHDRQTLERAAVALGQLHIMQGDRLQAESVWRAFIKAHPTSPLVLDALEQSLLQGFRSDV